MVEPAREVASQAPVPLAHEELLVRRSASGDASAFNELVVMYRTHVYLTAARLVGPELAEDVTQEAFLRAWRYLPSLRRTYAFRAWLDRVTRSAVVDCLRTREFAQVSLDTANGAAEVEATGQLLTDGRDHLPADTGLETQELAAAMRELPESQRAAICLFHLEGRPISEVALALGTTTTAIKSRLYAARRTLCRRLSAEGADGR